MGALPSTVYKRLREEQRKLFRDGYEPCLRMGDIYRIMCDEYGYRQSTANKWLLNWAVCLQVKFEEDDEGYKVRFGDFHDLGLQPKDMLCGGKVWLPCKEVWIDTPRGKICMTR